ncbi:DUF3006 family protein [Lysinibacillus telephonicus]|uniref:DUF3006 family protein n=1 Tax=Lysinibacillus telephonicus TaxID=1714840 RepID=UPI003BA10DFB
MKKYTLDRIEDNVYVFLSKEDESQQLLIQENRINIALKEGDIVKVDEDGAIEVLEEETKITREKVNDLIEKLKNKK